MYPLRNTTSTKRIARALHLSPAVLVLDEATSALDGATERAVGAAIENVARVKTLIIIARRLSTVRNSDAVYVIDYGRIVASGTYDELMESSARFQERVRGRGRGKTGVIGDWRLG